MGGEFIFEETDIIRNELVTMHLNSEFNYLKFGRFTSYRQRYQIVILFKKEILISEKEMVSHKICCVTFIGFVYDGICKFRYADRTRLKQWGSPDAANGME